MISRQQHQSHGQHNRIGDATIIIKINTSDIKHPRDIDTVLSAINVTKALLWNEFLEYYSAAQPGDRESEVEFLKLFFDSRLLDLRVARPYQGSIVFEIVAFSLNVILLAERIHKGMSTIKKKIKERENRAALLSLEEQSEINGQTELMVDDLKDVEEVLLRQKPFTFRKVFGEMKEYGSAMKERVGRANPIRINIKLRLTDGEKELVDEFETDAATMQMLERRKK